MTRAIRTGAATAFLLLAFLLGRFSSALTVAHAQPAPRQQTWNVPKAWGQFKGVYYDQLLFEDEAGTIRSVYPNSTSVVFTIRRR